MSLECKRSVPELPLFCFQAAPPFSFCDTRSKQKEGGEREAGKKSSHNIALEKCHFSTLLIIFFYFIFQPPYSFVNCLILDAEL